MTKYLIGLLIIAGLVISAITWKLKSVTEDRDRQESNMENVTKDNKELTLKIGEYNNLEGDFKDKLDSVIKDNEIKLNQVTQATIIKTVYKDTTITKIVYREATQKPDGSFIVPVSFDSQCWGMTGQILSIDSKAKFNITEKRANNNIQLVVTRNKYFLGFLWRTKKAEYNVYSDCGPAQFTDIKFKK